MVSGGGGGDEGDRDRPIGGDCLSADGTVDADNRALRRQSERNSGDASTGKERSHFAVYVNKH